MKRSVGDKELAVKSKIRATEPAVMAVSLLDLIVATPKSWIVTFLSDWIELRAVLRMDSAFCIKRHRDCILDLVKNTAIAELNTEKLNDGGVNMVNWIESRGKSICIRNLQLTNSLCCNFRARQTVLFACGNSLRSVQIRHASALQDTFLDLALYNQHLTSFDIMHCPNYFHPAIMLARCSSLTKLSISGCNLHRTLFTEISTFCPQLESLTLNQCILRDAMCEPLLNPTSPLRALVLSAPQPLLLDGLFKLFGTVIDLVLTDATSVDFTRLCIGMPLLPKCTILRVLPSNPISDTVAQLITQQWIFLEVLRLHGTTAYNVSASLISESSAVLLAIHCPQLHTFSFTESAYLVQYVNPIAAASIQTFAHAAARYLQVASFHKLSSHNIKRLIGECPRLHTLHVHQCTQEYYVHCVSSYLASPVLQHVHVEDCRHFNWQVLLSTRSLVFLSMQHCNTLTDQIVIALADHNPALKYLCMEGFTQVTHKSVLAAVRKCAALEKVKFTSHNGGTVTHAQKALLFEVLRDIRPTLKGVEISF